MPYRCQPSSSTSGIFSAVPLNNKQVRLCSQPCECRTGQGLNIKTVLGVKCQPWDKHHLLTCPSWKAQKIVLTALSAPALCVWPSWHLAVNMAPCMHSELKISRLKYYLYVIVHEAGDHALFAVVSLWASSSRFTSWVVFYWMYSTLMSS